MPNIITIIDRANVPRKGYWINTKYSAKFHAYLIRRYEDVPYTARDFTIIYHGILTVTAQLLTIAVLEGFQLEGNVGIISHPLKRSLKKQHKRRSK